MYWRVGHHIISYSVGNKDGSKYSSVTNENEKLWVMGYKKSVVQPPTFLPGIILSSNKAKQLCCRNCWKDGRGSNMYVWKGNILQFNKDVWFWL